MTSRPPRSPRTAVALAVAVAAVAGAASPAAANPALRRELAAYFIFANRNASLKDLILSDPCNVGVNCQQPNVNSSCGVVSFEDPQLADGSQVAGDVARFTAPGGSIYQLFRNGGGSLANVTIRLPGGQPDGSDPLVPLPLLPDVDGDGMPSCSAGCALDLGDLEQACGFPIAFPACDPGRPVDIQPNADCPAGVVDAVPGNGRCDLPPGQYGTLTLRDLGRLTFVGGAYDLCDVIVGRNTSTLAGGPTVLHVAAGGGLSVNNDSTFGSDCGEIAVQVKGTGTVSFGRDATIVASVCNPAGLIRLGHNNTLTGQFVGDTVSSDASNEGHCCVGGACGCFDGFVPGAAAPGDTVTLTSLCDLTAVTAVRICGLAAAIGPRSPSSMEVTVPAAASGACVVQAECPAGVYVANDPLQVN